MKKQWITEKQIVNYRLYLQNEEKSQATVEKYIRDVQKFSDFLEHSTISREQVLAYKKDLVSRYKAVSVNSMLAALNSFLTWKDLPEFKVRPLKIQRQIFRPQEKELTKGDYTRLLNTAKRMNNERLNLIMQTICAAGIRISELSFITVESLKEGYVQVSCKNKTRYIWLPKNLRKQLHKYVKKQGIVRGAVFVTRTGKAIGRGLVWKQMKKIARDAGVDERRVYPHNLRHLFARTFYGINKDIIKLSDILGHSSIETTRIYTLTTGKEYAGYLEGLGLVSGSKT